MTPSRPYLLLAFYNWIVDNGLTAYIVVDATVEGVRVPERYIDNGRIVLNISPRSVLHLSMESTYVSFEARFSGTPHAIYVPMKAIQTIYAKENGRGMVFKDEEDYIDHEEGDRSTGNLGKGFVPELVKTENTTASRSTSSEVGVKKGKPTLTIVK